ncbi:hypothetical protein [Dokdonella koreensis]|uniref:hypothetical protein n=1 Tax=Dokdonella koreensis TaxID=323415 RepID=UPI00123752D2|nr:hypothetical protein [Dokdonella koreensis]
MTPNIKKAQVLLAVAEGQTVVAAARAAGLSPAQGKSAVVTICRVLGMAPDVAEIRANPVAYRDAAQGIIDDPKQSMNKDLRGRLVRGLKLRNPDELTPHYVSNLTASSMLTAGFTWTTVADTQAWLVAHGLRFKPQAPKEGGEAQAALRAVLLLDAFGLDVKAAQDALCELDQPEM